MVPKPGPNPSLDDIEILQFISDSYGPAVGTADIAEHFDVKTQTASKYLNRLSEGGFVETRKVGRARIWWLTPAGEREISPDYSSESQ